jgi:hypothetical protein
MTGCIIFGCFASTTKQGRDDSKAAAAAVQPPSPCTVQCPPEETVVTSSTPEAAIKKRRKRKKANSGEENRLLFEAAEGHEAPLTGPNTKYYFFPIDKVTRMQWTHLCGRDKKFVTRSSAICSRHFPKSQYNLALLAKNNFKMRGVDVLLPSAVPSISLPLQPNKTESQIERDCRATKRKIENRY